MLHGLQVPGYAVGQQRKAACSPSPVVVSDSMKKRACKYEKHITSNYYVQKLLFVQKE
jgi:hypothetical protein